MAIEIAFKNQLMKYIFLKLNIFSLVLFSEEVKLLN